MRALPDLAHVLEKKQASGQATWLGSGRQYARKRRGRKAGKVLQDVVVLKCLPQCVDGSPFVFVWTVQAHLLGLSSQAVIKYLKLVSQTGTLVYFKPVQTLEYFSFSSFGENYWLACLPLIWTEQKEQLWFRFGYVLSWASTWSLAAAQQCSVSTA